MDIPDTLEFLLGRWILERTIADHRTGMDCGFRGAATLAAARRAPDEAASRATYEEQGRFCQGSYQTTARRSLHYLRRGGAVAIAFADGRPFIELDLRGGSAHAQHPCGEDRYQLAFWIHAADLVEERWWVRGPAKHYDARTLWRRATRTA